MYWKNNFFYERNADRFEKNIDFQKKYTFSPLLIGTTLYFNNFKVFFNQNKRLYR